MINQFIMRLYIKLADFRITLLALVVTLPIMYVMLNMVDSEMVNSLHFAFTKASAEHVIEQWRIERFMLFKKFFWLDFIFPAGYGIIFSSLIARLSLRRVSRNNIYQTLFLIPLAATIFDYAENMGLIITLNNLNNLIESVVFITSVLSSFKMILFILSLLIILWLVLLKVLRR